MSYLAGLPDALPPVLRTTGLALLMQTLVVATLLHEALRLVLNEGLENRWRRHEQHQDSDENGFGTAHFPSDQPTN